MHKWLIIVSLFWLMTTTATAQNIPLESGSWNIAWDASGSRLAVAEPNGFIAVYDLNGELLTRFSAHNKRVKALAWNPVNNVLASSGWDGFLRFWDIETTTLIHEMNLWDGAGQLAWHPDGVLLATSTLDTLSVWDTTTFQLIASAGASVLDIDWRSDGSDFAATDISGVIIVRIEGERFALIDFKINGLPVRLRGESVDWNHNETMLVSVGNRYPVDHPEFTLEGSTIRLWDVETAEQISVLYVSEDEEFTDAIFVGDTSQHIIAITQEGSVYTFDAGTGELLSRREKSAFLWMLAWNDQHDLLAIGGTATGTTVRDDDPSSTGFLDIQPLTILNEE